VPGAELVLRAGAAAPDPDTTIIVNCAGRTRSIIGAQSLINAGVKNKVAALRNGTIGWTLAGQTLETWSRSGTPKPAMRAPAARPRHATSPIAPASVRSTRPMLDALRRTARRTLYRFDVRTPEEYAAGHPPASARRRAASWCRRPTISRRYAARASCCADDLGSRADMTASWLAQMGWDVYVLDGGFDGRWRPSPARSAAARGQGRYKRPYEGTDNRAAAMQAYLDWEYGLVDQLARDGTHGFFVI
jgi:rhodanese-related sulfurtransferase